MKRKNKEGRENDLRKEEVQLKNISVNFAGYTYIYILFTNHTLMFTFVYLLVF